MTEQMRLELFVSGGVAAVEILRSELEKALTDFDIEADIKIIDVLLTPDEALANDVFATPTLVRRVPEPVLKIIADAAKISNAVVLMKPAER